MPELITSKSNSTLQHVRKLMASRKYRYECRAFVADGTKLVEEALRWGLGVDALILRAADAFDVPVILADGCADPYGEKTVRATMGAVFRRPPVQAATEEILAQCGAKQLPICVTALSDRAEDVRWIELASCVTVIGSEGQGVSEAFLSAASREAIIPMSPRCESLNAAVAATVILWELRRDR